MIKSLPHSCNQGYVPPCHLGDCSLMTGYPKVTFSGGLRPRYPEVLVLYLKYPRAKSGELRRCEGALQIQRLERSRPAGLWDLYLDEPVLIVCECALAVRVLGFQ